MCNTQTQQFIDQVVAQKVANDVMFTLFDVTVEVQSLEKAAGISISRHREIHDDVLGSANAESLSNGWSRNLRAMGAGLSAMVYFNPIVHDVNTYQPMKRKDSPQAAATNPALDGVNPAALAFAQQPVSAPKTVNVINPLPAGTFSSSPISMPAPDGYKNVDQWNRLRLPCEVMRAAGFLPGDQAYAVVDNGKLSFVKNYGSAQPIAKYIVDCRCNIRVTPRTLKAAGLSATAYKMTASNGNVIVEQ